MTSLSCQDIETFISEKKKIIIDALRELFSEKIDIAEKSLFEAAYYAIFPVGKLLRPLLTFAVAESYGVEAEKVTLPACCIEIIHTYSLIHDDLPCMDDDDFRRGKPSLHKTYTEGHAVLTGDFLLTFAFELLSKAPTLSAKQKLSLIEILSIKAGSKGMIGGQNLDIAYTGKTIDWKIVEKIHLGKTAALIQASLAFGGIIAEAKETDMRILEEFGRLVGLGFQIIDDILDVTGDEKELGKPIGSDQKKHKITAVSILGLEKAKDYGNELAILANKELKKLSVPCEHLELLSKKLLHRTY